MKGGNEVGGKTAEDFLLAEYRALIDIDTSRNDRLDRFLTLFLTLAASPWALYALMSRDDKSAAAFSTLPLPLAVVFFLTGMLGFLVMMMFVQVRFLIILYTRAMNAIRGHFAEKGAILGALRLPVTGDVPPYYEPGSYVLIAVIGMGLVNAAYATFGMYHVLAFARLLVRILANVLLFLVWFLVHLFYYRRQAAHRQDKDRGSGKLTFRQPSHPRSRQ